MAEVVSSLQISKYPPLTQWKWCFVNVLWYEKNVQSPVQTTFKGSSVVPVKYHTLETDIIGNPKILAAHSKRLLKEEKREVAEWQGCSTKANLSWCEAYFRNWWENESRNGQWCNCELLLPFCCQLVVIQQLMKEPRVFQEDVILCPVYWIQNHQLLRFQRCRAWRCLMAVC